jgi:hypothetical protein
MATDSFKLGYALNPFSHLTHPPIHSLPPPMLYACVYATILLGFFGILLKENLVMKIIAMDVMSTGVIALFVLVAAGGGHVYAYFYRWFPARLC